MSHISTFISKYQEQLKWALVGALIALGIYISYEALAGVLILLFGGGLAQDHKKVMQQRREAIKSFEDHNERVDKQADELKDQVEASKTAAGEAKAKEVDSFIDGEWK